MSRELRASNRQDVVILVDDDLYDAISVFKWRIDNKGYPVRTIYPDLNNKKRRTKLTLHRSVMGAPPKPLVTDHINRNKFDNRRENLRFVTNAENCRNKDFSSIVKRRSSTRSPGRRRIKYDPTGRTGIRVRKGRWSSYTHIQGRQIYLGTFKNQAEALESRLIAMQIGLL